MSFLSKGWFIPGVIIKSFKNQYKIAFLSRGYNRNSSGYILANDRNSAQEIGDEPYLIKKNHKKLIVSVSENRVFGIQKIIKSFKGIQMFVLDDAFQHRRLKCSLNILLSKFLSDKPRSRYFVKDKFKLFKP